MSDNTIDFRAVLEARRKEEHPPPSPDHRMADLLEDVVTAEREGRCLGVSIAYQIVDREGEEQRASYRRYTHYLDSYCMTHQLTELLHNHVRMVNEAESEQQEEWEDE